MFGARRLLNLRKLSLSHQEELRSDVSKAVEVSNEAEGHLKVKEFSPKNVKDMLLIGYTYNKVLAEEKKSKAEETAYKKSWEMAEEKSEVVAKKDE
ncbi:hypothetical protein HID58_034556 [Brassica napus]|uniref:Uncharacterized protein n=1 Tax=Brassica napus TaxID=3708 RepID=A0ABQ8C2F0_BRANA|nr:hypothetical protein HID58_034556 [Brassica napus]